MQWILVILLFVAPSVHAQPAEEGETVLEAQRVGRSFLKPVASDRSEKTMPLNDAKGKALDMVYAADRPAELRISYPMSSGGENVIFNPIDSVSVRLQPTDRARIIVDLAASPAWSPWRDRYLLHVIGSPETTVQIFSIEPVPVSWGGMIAAAVRQLFLDEPLLLSSINVLWGYRALGVSVTTALGVLLLLVVLGIRMRNLRRDVSCELRTLKQIAVVCLFFLLLYDARFTFDLARTMAADYRQYISSGQYRQMGPAEDVAQFLDSKRQSMQREMSVAVCTDGQDFLIKQLRYLLYPVPVYGSEAWRDATHGVFIDTDRAVVEDGGIACGDGIERPGTTLRTFPQSTRVVRFSHP